MKTLILNCLIGDASRSAAGRSIAAPAKTAAQKRCTKKKMAKKKPAKKMIAVRIRISSDVVEGDGAGSRVVKNTKRTSLTEPSGAIGRPSAEKEDKIKAALAKQKKA